MQLPRRVPWTSLAELDEVCNWIYAEDRTSISATEAINRLSAWRVITPLPHALETTLSLLTSISLDEKYCETLADMQKAQEGPSNATLRMNALSLSVRQSYATALVRMVNGLVDPLQSGMYARSIASIAAQIGLPQWLVELRHAATHEDLPSLELLRRGAQEALTWLLNNYFMPTLSPTYQEQAPAAVKLSPISPLLKRYKSVMKVITRDASLSNQYKPEVRDIFRSVERWIGEAKIAATSAIFNGWGAEQSDEASRENERWAMEQLCEALTEKGGLVPTSVKKRLVSKSHGFPVLPQNLIDVWAPLLENFSTNHSTFPHLLATTIADCLVRKGKATEQETKISDMSYRLCLVAWCAWCIDHAWPGNRENSGPEESTVKRQEFVSFLLSLQGSDLGTQANGSAIHVLLDLLLQSDIVLKEKIRDLRARRDNHLSSTNDDSTDDALVLMEHRLKTLLSVDGADSSNIEPKGMDMDDTTTSAGLPEGWSKAAANAWKSCPIGVYQ